MMVLNTNLAFIATGSPSMSPGDLELVLLLSIFLILILKQLTLAFWIQNKKNGYKVEQKTKRGTGGEQKEVGFEDYRLRRIETEPVVG